jgi:hypothetical protein
LLLVSPFLYDQLHASALRGGVPIVLTPVEVLNERAVSAAGPAANWAAYWIVFLVVEFPAIYLTGLISFAWLIRTTTPDRDRKAIVFAFGMMLALSLLCAWLLASTWGENNDLGWRVVLPAVFALMIFAASGLSQLKQRPALLTFSAACILIALGLPDAALLMRENVVAAPTPSSKEFKAAPPLWDAVRRHAQPTERIVNNPRFLELMTPWRANISWALLSNRRSCDAGESYLGPFTVLSDAQQEQVTLQFDRVFDGNAQVDDIKDLVTKYNCSVAVLVPSDGAWNRDPFASSPYYKSVETTADWRIYKAVGASGT